MYVYNFSVAILLKPHFKRQVATTVAIAFASIQLFAIRSLVALLFLLFLYVLNSDMYFVGKVFLITRLREGCSAPLEAQDLFHRIHSQGK